MSEYKPDGVSDNVYDLINALDKAITLIYTISTRNAVVPWDTIHRWENLVKYARKESEGMGMSNANDMFQVDYLPEKKEIRINLPEKVWENIDTVVMTRLFQEELVVGKKEESEVEESEVRKDG